MRDDAAGARALRAVGLRVTQPRLAVLGAVRAHAHATTDELIVAARTHLAPLSHQAVYDVLRVLTESGLVRRIQPQGSVARYEARVGDNHHHLVCRGCGGITDVDCAVGAAPCLAPGHPVDGTGFVVDEAEITFWGLCAACAAAAHPSDTPPVPTREADR
ncbi:Fur family transcriptional regulator [Quadrisphaera sp. INWT6]|uniref:Fur family transcriptional regulator n=1 Tax=Quadrisphaera sp. INWT6 TaxID=2596917 RepID=UPI0018923767|nr:Fur family transcriptional regulator [Quadrisphaera sp. INWT6]MBF5083042.1 transcriptional repressor [Quadrisphaera sp. INWT6]